MPKAAKGDEAANETEAAADAEAENENEAATTPTQASSPTTTRAKIEQRLQRAIDDAPPTKNRSPELVPLTAEYEKMRKNLRNLVAMVKHYAETTGQMNAARDNLVTHLGMMSQRSPIEQDLSGLGSSAPPAEANQGSRSLAAVQKAATAQSAANQKEFEQHAVTFSMEWEKAVTERVDHDLSVVTKLKGDREHYDKKVELLRRKTNDLEGRGKTSPRGNVMKLERNEEKLKVAFLSHEAAAGKLCALIESVINEGWIELYQLCRNYMKWESNRVARETDIYGQLAGAIDSLKATYKKNAPKQMSTSTMKGGASRKGGNGSGKKKPGAKSKK